MSAETAQNTTLETVPTSWPGAFGLYKYSKAAVLTNWQVLIGLMAISIGVGIALGTVQLPLNLIYPSDSIAVRGTSVFMEIVSNFISLVLSAFTLFVTLACAKHQKVSLSETFSKTTPKLLNLFLGMILMYLVAIVSFLALIIPFFIFAPRIILTPYYILDKNLGPVDALKASWNDTNGNLGKIYGIIGASIAFALPIITILLIPLAFYWLFMYQAAIAILYLYVTKTSKGKVEAPA